MTTIAESISHTEYAHIQDVRAKAQKAADKANFRRTKARLAKVKKAIDAAKATPAS